MPRERSLSSSQANFLQSAGLDALVQSVINGKGAMPPRGGAPGLSDAQVRESVLAILEGAGVDVP